MSESMDLQKTGRDDPKLRTVTDRLTIVLFNIYLVAICWILLLKLGVRFSYMGKQRVDLVPFNDPSILSAENIMNTVVFVPLGIYAGVLFERWVFGKKLLFFFLLSFTVEALQYILRVGAFDITDIITNTLGGIIGFIVFQAIEKAFNNRLQAKKFINIMAATGTVIMIVLLLLLKMNMLPIRYQ
jgi:glycopeptide antibiotics resistance protein